MFYVDKVIILLLFFYGDLDINVLVGESYNMYMVLKLFGKDVDLIEYKGVDY